MFAGKRRFILLISSIFLAVLLSACAQALPETIPETGNGRQEQDSAGLDRLIANLEDAGAEVEHTGRIQQPFFDVEGEIITVNGEDVQVFEFPNQQAARDAAALISPDGLAIGTTLAGFREPPTFWQANQMIVLYIGENEAAIDLLTEELGRPVAQAGVAAAGPAQKEDMTDLEQFIEELEFAGAETQRGEMIEAPLFAVEGTTLDVNGEDVIVFEFPTRADALAAATVVGQRDWDLEELIPQIQGTAHIWRQGQIIAVYAGDNEEMISLLTDTLGLELRPAAEGPSPTAEPMINLTTLERELEEQGAVVERVSRLEQPLLNIESQLVHVDGEAIQVLEFPNAESARDSVGLVLVAGPALNTATEMNLINRPYVFQEGQLVVLYFGTDGGTVSLLAEALGQPLVEPQNNQ